MRHRSAKLAGLIQIFLAQFSLSIPPLVLLVLPLLHPAPPQLIATPVLADTPPVAEIHQQHLPTNHEQPPRGYCTQIWRALSSKSRCFEYLVDPLPVDDHRQQQQHQQQHQQHRGPDELVYVRLEAQGTRIGDIATKAINERLLEGLFGVLFEGRWPRESGSGFDTNETTTKKQQHPELDKQMKLADEIRAQILTNSGADSTNKCKKALERLVCRLVYPSCHFRRAEVSALVRAPCRDDCRLASELFCPNVDWPKLNLLLGWAVNASLRASLSPLELEISGDTPTTIHRHSSTRTATDDHHHLIQLVANSSGGLVAPEEALPTDATHQKQQQQPHNLSTRQDSNSNLNSSSTGRSLQSPLLLLRQPPKPTGMSLHFYWPHEHSLASCHQLPAAWPIDPSRQEIKETKEAHRRLPGHLKWRLASCSSAGLARWASQLPSSTDTTTTTTTTTTADRSNSTSCFRYSGKLNVTRSGLKCQSWASRDPHQHSGVVLLLENMRDAENSCRNPGEMEQMPWCYTQNPNVRWEFCEPPRVECGPAISGRGGS